MLITQLKAKETIVSLAAGKKVFIINCHGCKEVRFPEKEAARLQKELAAEGNVTGIMTTDYICNPENMELRLKKHMSKIQEADLEKNVDELLLTQSLNEELRQNQNEPEDDLSLTKSLGDLWTKKPGSGE